MYKFMTADEAVNLIKDGDTIGINSFLTLANPEAIHDALSERIEKTGSPRGLNLFCSAGCGAWDENRFADRYAKLGAVKSIVASHFMSMPVLSRMVTEGKMEGYCLPLGALSHAVRAGAAGQKYYFSKMGLNLFVDPRIEGPAMNDISKREIVRVVDIDGEEYLRYETPQIDIAFIAGTTVDPNGNITFENESLTVDALSLAQLTKARGGKVIVQVEKVSHLFSRPWNVIVPGVLVDAVVVVEAGSKTHNTELNPIMSGDIHVPASHMDHWMSKLQISSVKKRASKDQSMNIIGNRASDFLKTGMTVNIGIGIPETVGGFASKKGILKDIVLTVEAGGIGGLPAPGVAFGATIGADVITNMANQFDFYDGGGLDICFMGGLEADKHGNVNSHKLPDRFAGIGGFANITTATKNIVFCLNFTTKGLEAEVVDGKVVINTEGSINKFKNEIGAISFSAKNALMRGQNVYYVTERCVFGLTENGLKILEVFDGIDEQTQICDLLDFDLA